MKQDEGPSGERLSDFIISVRFFSLFPIFIRVHLCASVVSIPAVPLLTANEIRERLPAADHAETPAGNENFGGARPGIVV